MLTPAATALRRAADLRGPVAPCRRDRRPRPAPRRPDRAHRRRRHRRCDRRRPGHGALAGRDGQRAVRRRRDRHVPRDVGTGRRRAGDGRRHVDAPGDPRQRRPPARRLRVHGSWSRSRRLASGQSGVGRLAELPAIVDAVVAAVGARPVRAADPAARPPTRRAAAARPIWPAATSSSAPAGPAKRSTRSASSATARPARWASPSRTPRSRVAHGSRSSPPNIEVAAAARARPTVRVESTAELRAALHRLTHADDGRAGFDALVMAAAVGDFRPSHRRRHEARAWRRSDPRARADPGHPRPARADRRGTTRRARPRTSR